MNYGTATRFAPERVLEMAEEFFGPGGMGLGVRLRQAGVLQLAGREGRVGLRAQVTGGSTEVFFSTEGLDEPVRQFMVGIFEEAHLHPNWSDV